MAAVYEADSSAEFRRELIRRGGESAARCFQCATCSSWCELATNDSMFPRRQMRKAQWGLTDSLIADPCIWLCHQCNDCTVNCPRDARPGDVMQVLRSMAVEKLAVPTFMGKLVANAGTTWPFLLGVPLLFWIAALALVTGLQVPADWKEYGQVVPHWLLYVVFFSVTGFVTAVVWTSGKRFWDLLGASGKRTGSFFQHLIPVAVDIMTHKRFDSCDATKTRRWGHFMLLWGFVGAAVWVHAASIRTIMPIRKFVVRFLTVIFLPLK